MGDKAKSKPFEEFFQLRFGHFSRRGVKAAQQKSKVELLLFTWGFPLSRIFQPIPTYSSQDQPVSAHSSLFQPTTAYSSLLQSIPACSRLFQPVLTHSSLFQPIPAFSSLFQPNLSPLRIFQPIPAYSSLFQAIQAYSIGRPIWPMCELDFPSFVMFCSGQ